MGSFKNNLMENGVVIMIGLCEFSWSYFIIVSMGAMALIGIAIYLEKEG